MAQQIINIGNTANDGTGSPLRTAFTIVNDNFSELYNLGGVSGIANGTSNISIALNSTINMSSAGTADVLVIFPTGAVLDGDLEVSTGNISVTGNVITDQYFLGDGGLLSNVTAVANAGEIVGNTLSSNVLFSSLQTVGVLANLSSSGNIVTVATANISTGNVITGGAVSATGNVQAGNIRTSGTASATGNIVTGSNVVAGTSILAQANVSAVGNVEGAFLLGNARFVTGLAAPFANALVGTTLSPNVINSTLRTVGVLDNLTVSNALGGTGNASMGNISVSTLITSNDQITAVNLSASGTVILGASATLAVNNTSGSAVSVGGNVTGGNLRTGGAVSAAGTVTGGNISTVGAVSATGNITGNYILGNGALLSGIDTSPENISNGASNVDIPVTNGNILVTANAVTVATFYESGLSVGGNVDGGNLRTGGQVSATGNITTAGFFIGTFQGNISGNITAAGLTTQVMYNKDGIVAGSTGMTFVDTSNTFTVTGVISSAGNVVGNGVFLVQNTTAATSNVTGSLRTLGGMGVAGNLYMGGLLSVDGGVNFNTISQDLNFGDAQTTGNTVIGGTAQTGILTVGRSAANATVNIATGATASDRIKILNIGTGGTANSATTINIGTGAGNANVVITANTQVNIANTGGSALTVAGNVTGGNIRTTGQVSATGTVTGGNVTAGGNISAGGNLSGAAAVQFTTTTQDINVGNAQTTGNIIVGGTAQTGTITLGQTTANATVNLATGAAASDRIKTVNIGTGGLANSITNINVGTAAGNGTVTFTANTVVTIANVSGTALSTAGNITAANINTAGLSLSGNVVSGLNVTGTATAGNVVTNGNLAVAGAVQFTATTQDINLGNAQTTGNLVIGGINQTGTVTVAQTDRTHTLNIDTGATVLGNTRTINVGTNGVANSSTVISVGTALGNSTVTVEQSIANATLNLSTGASASDRTKSVNIGTGGIANSITTITMGPSLGNSTISLAPSTANSTLNLASGAVASDRTKIVNIGTGGAANSATTVNIGATTGNANVLIATNTTVNIANTSGSALTVAGNVTGGNINTGGQMSATGTTTGGNLVTGGNLAVSAAVQFTATTQNINIGNSQTTGTIVMGGTTQTGAITVGQSTANSTLSLAAGAVAASNTKTVNIATGGAATSNTIINVGSSDALATTVMQLNASTTLRIANTSGTALSVAGNVIVSSISAGSQMSAAGNITSSGFFIGNGSLLTGLAATYGDANVVTLLSNFGSNNISTTGNIITSVLAAASAVQFTATTQDINLGNAQTTGNLVIGGTVQTGTVTVGRTNDTSTVNIASGQTATAKVKTINVGTGGLAGSTTTINFGASTGVGTATFSANTTVAIANTSGTALSVGGNITGSFFIGNGSQLTGLPASYSDSNVATFMANFGSNTISTSGNITGGNIIATADVISSFSDQRLKANIQPIVNAMEKIMAIRGVTFQPNDTAAEYGFRDTSLQLGVLAQDIEKVLPEIVKPAPFDTIMQDGVISSRSGENFKTIQYDRLVPLLIEAIKELKIEVDQLRSGNN